MVKKKTYWIENTISKAQNVVSHLDLSAIWAGAFQKRNILGDNFLEVPLDFHFIGAALLKADSLTVMITFSVAHFNLHCHCPLTLPPPPPIKWKPSRALTTTSKRWSRSALLTRKRYFQGPKCGFTFGSGLAPFKKRNHGDNFLEVVLDFHFIGAALLKAASLTVTITFSVTQFNLHYHCPLTLPPPPPIKWKPSRTLTTTSKRLPTSALLNRKRYFQGRKCGSRLGWHLSRKEILGTIFWKWC